MDMGTLVGLVFLVGFIGAIVWGELLSRRKRRQLPEEKDLPAPDPQSARNPKRAH